MLTNFAEQCHSISNHDLTHIGIHIGFNGRFKLFADVVEGRV